MIPAGISSPPVRTAGARAYTGHTTARPARGEERSDSTRPTNTQAASHEAGTPRRRGTPRHAAPRPRPHRATQPVPGAVAVALRVGPRRSHPTPAGLADLHRGRRRHGGYHLRGDGTAVRVASHPPPDPRPRVVRHHTPPLPSSLRAGPHPHPRGPAARCHAVHTQVLRGTAADSVPGRHHRRRPLRRASCHRRCLLRHQRAGDCTPNPPPPRGGSSDPPIPNVGVRSLRTSSCDHGGRR